MILTIYTDGGSLNNPGTAACGFALYENLSLLYSEGILIGIATNNVAEYTGLIRSLEKTAQLVQEQKIPTPEKIIVKADSELMVKQMSGQYRVKSPTIKELFYKAKKLEGLLKTKVSYFHIPREQNQYADSLVKGALGR